MGNFCGKLILVISLSFVFLSFPLFAQGKALDFFLYTNPFEWLGEQAREVFGSATGWVSTIPDPFDTLASFLETNYESRSTNQGTSIVEDKPLHSPPPVTKTTIVRERALIREDPQVITNTEVVREVIVNEKETTVVRDPDTSFVTHALASLKDELVLLVNEKFRLASSSQGGRVTAPGASPSTFPTSPRVPGTGYVPDDGDFVYIRRPAKTGSNSNITLINTDGKIPELSTSYFASVPNIFSSISNASSTNQFTASGVGDTLSIAGSGGTSVSFDSTNKRITISSTGGGSTSSTLLNILNNGSDASTFTGTTQIASLTINSSGVITAGTWQGTAITAAYGGTGTTSYTAGDLLYASGAAALSKLGIGAANTVLTSSGSAPQWSTSLTLAGTLTVSGTTTSTFSGPLVANSTLCLSSDCRTVGRAAISRVLVLPDRLPSGPGQRRTSVN